MRILLLLLATLSMAGVAGAADPAPMATQILTAHLSDLDNHSATLEGFKGRPLVINFWARWCGPCRTEIPNLVSERGRFKDKGLEVVGIALDDKPDAVRDFAKAYGIDYPVLVAKDQGIELMKTLGNDKAGLPFTVVFDRQGHLVARRLGAFDESEMAAAFAAAVK